MDRRTVEHRWLADRVPEVMVRRDRLHRRQIPADLGGVSRRRQEAEGEEPADRSDAWPYLRRCARLRLPLSVVLGRQGGGGGRQDGLAEQPGDGRIGEVYGCLLEGCTR